MKLLKISLTLLCITCAAYATPSELAQEFLKQTYDTIQKHQNTIVVGGACAVATAYMAHAIYLDGIINDKNSLWHWSFHHIKNGLIDQDILIRHIEERYPDLTSLHTLTAIFATAHEAQMEIDACLTLRGILKTLKNVHLEWIMSETIATLDKKLESLYVLKIMLCNCTSETRNRCKKNARL